MDIMTVSFSRQLCWDYTKVYRANMRC